MQVIILGLPRPHQLLYKERCWVTTPRTIVTVSQSEVRLDHRHLRQQQQYNDNQRQADLMCQGSGRRGAACIKASSAATLIPCRSEIRLKIERGIDLNGWRTNCLIKLRADQI